MAILLTCDPNLNPLRKKRPVKIPAAQNQILCLLVFDSPPPDGDSPGDVLDGPSNHHSRQMTLRRLFLSAVVPSPCCDRPAYS